MRPTGGDDGRNAAGGHTPPSRVVARRGGPGGRSKASAAQRVGGLEVREHLDEEAA